MKLKPNMVCVFAILIFAGCNNATEKTSTSSTASAAVADAIYYGGDIITMEGDSASYSEAVAVKAGKIVFVGSKADAEKMKGDSTAMNDLQGKTLVPGFIDTHIHWGQFVLLSELDKVDPVGIPNIEAFLTHLNELAKKTPEGEWIISYGYEKVLTPPYRNLIKNDLDKISKKHPIFILYNNFHWGTANSLTLEQLEITRASPTNLPGGGINFKDAKGEPTGLLTESAVYAIMPVVTKLMPAEKLATLTFEIANQLSANGVTTVADMSSGSSDGINEIEGYKKLAHDPKFALRFSATPLYEVLPQLSGPMNWDGEFQATSIKLLMDASLAGGTSATVKPQLNGSTGNLNYTPEAYEKAVKESMDKGFSVTTHVMGDRAHKVMLQAMEDLAGKYDFSKMHNTIEHSAIIDPADIPLVKKMNLSVGFLSPFLYTYGDPMLNIVYGPEMAPRLFGAAEYDKQGINTCHHSDAPIIESRPLSFVWCAVNRTTSGGKVLGPQFKQAPYSALLGVTRNAARHLGLGKDLGSITVDKMADFAIVDQNPLKIGPAKIRDIKVLKTIKGGRTYFDTVKAN